MRSVLFLIVLLWLATSLSASIIHVPAEQPTIQAGIDAAVGGDTVLVAAGTYSGGGNKAIRFYGKAIVLTSEAGPEATILSTDSGRTITVVDSETVATVIDGFTIEGNSTDTWNPSRPYSGGIETRSYGVTIRNCTIRNCYAAIGGGLFALSGVGIQIIDCRICNNRARVAGGGVACGASGFLISGCRIVSNQADSLCGGGVYVGGSGRFLNCYIGQNRCKTDGGGIDGEGNIAVDSCCIAQNSARQGGAIFYTQDGLALTNSIIYNNVATYAFAGVCAQSLDMDIGSKTVVSHCTFACNYSADPRGDGIAFISGQIDAPPFSEGQWRTIGWSAHADSGVIRDNIFAFNSSAAIYSGFVDNPAVISHNDVWQVIAGPKYAGELDDQTGLNGNFSADPLFCSVSDSTLTLDALSPCLSAGSDGSTIGAREVGCDNYAAGPPRCETLSLLGEDPSIEDTVQATIDRARPWDTLSFIGNDIRTSGPITIDRPLYLSGVSQDSTDLECGYPVPGGFIFTSFAVCQRMGFNAPALIGPSPVGQNVVCQLASPIFFNCEMSSAGLTNTTGCITVAARGSSPYFRACAILSGWQAVLFAVDHGYDIIATNCYWGETDEAAIAELIWDGNDYPFTNGRVIFHPILFNSPTPVEEESAASVPQAFALRQNYPNPFNPTTTISFDLPKVEEVTLTVYNLLGQEVARLLDHERLAVGSHQVKWDAQDAGTGIYLYRVETPTRTSSRKMMLVK